VRKRAYTDKRAFYWQKLVILILYKMAIMSLSHFQLGVGPLAVKQIIMQLVRLKCVLINTNMFT
jgi:hypothetical protein